MTTFDDREKAFEAKYRLDQETTFRVTVRRDKLLGLWVAERLGMTGPEADSYARSVIDGDVGVAGHHDVVVRLLKDAADRGKPLDEEVVRKQAVKFEAQARAQVLAELKAK